MVKKELGSGIDAQDIGKTSCRVSATKVLIKKRIGRYLVDDSKKEVEVLAVVCYSWFSEWCNATVAEDLFPVLVLLCFVLSKYTSFALKFELQQA